jgi:predicted ATPase
LFDAERHLAAAQELITDPEELLTAAELHADAGQIAQKAAAYPLGFSCFEGGIALLNSDAWNNNYDLTLRLHAGAVETAYLSGQRAPLEQRSADVRTHARQVMDQLVAWETEIDALAGRQEYAAAIDAGCKVLGMLGSELPAHPTEADVGAALRPTLARLSEIGIDGMRRLPEVDDARAAAITRIQVRLSPVAYFGRPLLLPIIACNLVTTSIDRGLSTATPYGLSLFGIVLNTLEMYEVSHAWGRLALELLDRWPKDRRLETATRHILFDLVCTWMVPLSSTLSSLREVFDIGRQTGDYEYAGFAAHGYVHNSIYAGRPLQPLKEEALYLGEQLAAFGVNALNVHRPFEQLLKALTGALEHPSCLDDETFSEQASLAKAETDGAKSSICVLNLTIGLVRFHFGKPSEASRYFEVARANLDGAPSVWHPPIVHQFAALSAAAAWHETDAPERRAQIRERIDQSLEALRRLAKLTPLNFAHRVSLIEAEVLRLEGDSRGALAKFKLAMSQAQEGSWINDVALAHELAAKCHDNVEAAKQSLRAARTGYAAWGANAKAERVGQRIAELTAQATAG